VLVALTTASCTKSRVMCDYAPFDDTIVGTLVARHGPTATFAVESTTPGPSAPASRPKAPTIVNGTRLAVHYPLDQVRFLRVGHRYRVSVWWFSGRFESGVHVGADVCSTGTVNANGSAINTSSWSRARKAVLVGAAVVVLVFVASTVTVGLRRRRRRGSSA
jgi:hypothetical protein